MSDLRDLLKRIRQWDALDIPDSDGAYWKREIDAALEQPEQCPNCASLEAQNTELDRKLAALEQPEQQPVEIKPPNPEGATQCIVRWWAETPAGWVGAWDREALEQFVHPPRREWRGLTDTERAAAQYESFKRGLTPLEFMELHEAALRSKNYG